MAVLIVSCAPGPRKRGRTGALSIIDAAPALPKARDPGYSVEDLTHLRPGRYELTVSGVMSNACTRAVVQEVKKVKGVENVSFDFESRFLRLEVSKKTQMKSRSLQRAVRRAGRRTRLGRRLWITEIRFAR